MTRYTRTIKKKKVVFVVYEPEEAAALHLTDTKRWAVAEAGEWCHTDDGYVCRVIRRNGPYTDKNGKRARFEITLPFGRAWNSKKVLSYTSYVRKPWIEREVRRTRAKNLVSLYARLMVERKGELTDRDWDAIGAVYRPDQAIPIASAKRLLRNKEVQAMVSDEIARILGEAGVTPTYVLDLYKKAIDVAVEEGHSSTIRAVAKDLGNMLEMTPRSAGMQVPMAQEEVQWELLLDGKEQELLSD